MDTDLQSITEYFNSAINCQKNGDLETAESLYRQILVIEPNHSPSISNLAYIFKHLGKYDLAIQLLRKLVHLDPKNSQAFDTMGSIHLERGNEQTAIDHYRQAIRVDPSYVSAYINLGLTYQKMDDSKMAKFYLRQGLKVSQNSSSLYFFLANAYYQSYEFESAVDHYRHAIRIEPNHFQAHSNLALSLKILKQYDSAIESLKLAIELVPHSANAHFNLANIYQEAGEILNAIQHYNTSIQLKSDFFQAYVNLGSLLGDLQHYSGALKCLKNALLIEPKDEEIHFNLGNLFAELLDCKKSNFFYQKAIQLGSYQAINNYLANLNYVDQIDPEWIYRTHKNEAKKMKADWAASEPLIHRETSSCHSSEKIKIGYLSSDFRTHSVAYFFLPIIENFDRNLFEVFCFSNSVVEDETTELIRSKSDHFFPIHQLSDAEAFSEIKRCNLHGLIELNGHTIGNRLTVLHRGIAKKVFSWIGYPNTTGLDSIDYKIVDSYCDPPIVSDQFYVEKLLRLDPFFLVYKPPSNLPQITPSPYLTNGYLTFGSFNNFKKINRSLIYIWSAVLKSFPKSKMILKNGNRPNWKQKKIFIECFQSKGIDSSRIKFVDRIDDQNEHLELYKRIDVSLDTYPYSGTTTTFESLVMGVPVFTLTGKSHISRVTGSIMKQLKLDKFIVHRLSNYVPKLKKIIQEKRNLDRGYRHKLLRSSLCDGPAFVKRFEEKLKHTVLR